MAFWNHQGGWSSQNLLQVFEGLLCVLGSLELVLFFEEFEEMEPPDVESLDESAQGSQTSPSTSRHHGDSRAASFW
jgi:hypothetical protein